MSLTPNNGWESRLQQLEIQNQRLVIKTRILGGASLALLLLFIGSGMNRPDSDRAIEPLEARSLALRGHDNKIFALISQDQRGAHPFLKLFGRQNEYAAISLPDGVPRLILKGKDYGGNLSVGEDGRLHVEWISKHGQFERTYPEQTDQEAQKQ